MNRGEVWLATVGRKTRPVVVLTRTEVLDVRRLVTVAEITTSIRGLSVEVPIDHEAVGIDHESVINCDGIHTIARSSLARHLGTLDESTMQTVCWAVRHALDCPSTIDVT